MGSQPEFDQYVKDYDKLHAQNIKLSGEDPNYFAKYKIQDLSSHFLKKNKNVKNILDFGSGIGNSVPHFKNLFKKANLFCADVSLLSLKSSHQKNKNQNNFIQYDGNTLPFQNNVFDLIFASGVFHHIPHNHHKHLLTECYRTLSNNGMLSIYEHNPYNPLTLKAVNECEFDQDAVLVNPYALQKTFKEAGFVNVKLKFKVFFPHFLRKLRFMEKHMEFIPFGAQYCVYGEKA